MLPGSAAVKSVSYSTVESLDLLHRAIIEIMAENGEVVILREIPEEQ